MRFNWETVELKLKETFRISRGELDSKKVVIVTIEEGIGEASASSYYGESFETALRFFERLKKGIEYAEQITELGTILNQEKDGFNQAARAAIDMAVLDLQGKQKELPVYKLLGLSGKIGVPISHTIGIDTIEKMQKKALRAKEFEILKVKVGVPGDMEMVKAVRQVTDKKIRVDANAGWQTDEAIKKINELEDLGVELVEQPLKPENKKGLEQIRKNTFVPVILDEPICTSGDIPQWAGLCDGINVKLMKSGGISEALNMVRLAKSLGMKVMLGCMIETSLGITAAAQLASEADYLDLDSHLLIGDDPFKGVGLQKGRLVLNDLPGLGVIVRAQSVFK